MEQAVTQLQICGFAVKDLGLEPSISRAVSAQETIMQWEMSSSLRQEWSAHGGTLNPLLRAYIEEGVKIEKTAYLQAQLTAAQERLASQELFSQVDALIVPSTTGEPPEREEGTGDPLFCRPWTLLGMPCVALPIARAVTGLPVGLQLVGPLNEDGRTLAIARTIELAQA
jgi:Asp-tRNA(Asn)/Glu-tRNA(Gln) amidotransferase A subunit family amidase